MAAIQSVKNDSGAAIELRYSIKRKYRTNIVVQHHRAIKRIGRPDARIRVLSLRTHPLCLDRGSAHANFKLASIEKGVCGASPPWILLFKGRMIPVAE